MRCHSTVLYIGIRLTVLGLSLLLFGCSKVIKPDPPILQSAAPPEIQAKESYINLPVRLDLLQLKQILTEQLGRDLYQEKALDVGYGIKIDLEILKTGSLELATQGGKLFVSLPLTIQGRAYWKKDLYVGSLAKSQDFKTRITFKTGSTIGISEDWKLKTDTQADFNFQEAPKVALFGYDVSLESIAAPALRRQLPYIGRMIDDYISQSFDLRSQADQLWRSLGEPMLATSEPMRVWAVFEPIGFNFAPPVSVNFNTLALNVGLRARIRTVAGEKPALKPLGPLPSLKSIPSDRRDFELLLPIAIDIDEAEKVVKANVNGTTYTVSGKRTVTIRDISLFGKGERLVAKVNFISKRIRGDLYLVGKPSYDPTAQVIEMRNLDLSSATNNLVANSAAWLADKVFLRKLQEQMRYDLKSTLSEARNSLQAALNEYVAHPNVRMSSRIQNLTVDEVYLEKGFIIIQAAIRGDVEVSLRK